MKPVNETRMSTETHVLFEMKQDMKSAFERIDRRFDKVDEKFEAMDNKFQRKFELVDQQIQKIDTQLETKIDKLENRIWSNFFWVMGAIISLGIGLSGLIAKAHSWI